MAARRWLRVVAEGGVGWWEGQRDWREQEGKVNEEEEIGGGVVMKF